MFPKALEVWVEHFLPNKFISSHFTQVILSTLFSFTIFEKVKYNEEFMCRPRWCLPNMIYDPFCFDEDDSDDDEIIINQRELVLIGWYDEDDYEITEYDNSEIVNVSDSEDVF